MSDPRSVMMLSCLVVILSIIAPPAYAWFPSSYPEYCTKDLSLREIPPLTTSQLALVKSIVQVQAVVRHGARTPYAGFSCWQNYTVTWNNCNVTELMLASPSMTSDTRPASWLFRKLYDGSDNYLGGNCYTGQLLSEGFDQETSVGSYLNAAYLSNSDDDLNLFNTSIWTDINTDAEVYLRSDDAQRTLMSGQILLHSMFNVTEEVIVPWHTGDYDLDQIYPNDEVCPRLDTVEETALSTSTYLAENSSALVAGLNSSLDSIFGAGYWDWDHVLDCLMTTVCTGNQIPDGSNGVLMNDDLFNATVAQVEYTYSYYNLYNSSQYAKLAMGNTAWHIRTNLESAMNASALNSTSSLKFALFAAHDTTIMPLLAAILGDSWDRKWASYAALVTFELYESTSSGFLFRIVYNSEPLLLPGCSDTLCDADTLLTALSFGEEYMPCTTTSDSTTVDGCDDSDDDNLGDSDVILIAFMSALFGGLVGAAFVIFVDKYRMKSKQPGNQQSPINSPMLDATTI